MGNYHIMPSDTIEISPLTDKKIEILSADEVTKKISQPTVEKTDTKIEILSTSEVTKKTSDVTMDKHIKRIDYLKEDEPVYGQKWICVSFLSPEGISNCKLRGFKFRGAYDSREDADKRASELQSVDPDFHVFVGEVGKWLPWDPDPNSIEDQQYKEEELQKLMKKYKENREQVKQMESERKEQMLKESLGGPKTEKERKIKRKKKLQEKLETKKLKETKLEDMKKDMEKIVQTETSIRAETDKLVEATKIIRDKTAKISEFDDQMAKINEAYEQVLKGRKDK